MNTSVRTVTITGFDRLPPEGAMGFTPYRVRFVDTYLHSGSADTQNTRGWSYGLLPQHIGRTAVIGFDANGRIESLRFTLTPESVATAAQL